MRIDMRKSSKVLMTIAICVCAVFAVPSVGRADTADTQDERESNQEISIQQFYNNGTAGADYVKAQNGAVVTISSKEDMKVFFQCLKDEKWTSGITFRQEADISFSDYTYSYNEKDQYIEIYNGSDKLAGICDRSGRVYAADKKTESSIEKIGLGDALVVNEQQEFAGTYEGQKHKISGFIVQGGDQIYSGLFGHIQLMANVSDINVENVLLMDSAGTFAGAMEGNIKNCTIRGLAAYGIRTGGFICQTGGYGGVRYCRIFDSAIVSAKNSQDLDFGICLGGVVSSHYTGRLYGCAAENIRIYSYGETSSMVGGIAGFMEGGDIVNAETFGTLSVPKKGEDYQVGGIVGKARSKYFLAIYNCVAAGGFYGGAAGGITGDISLKDPTSSEMEAYLENDVCLAKIDGTYAGAMTGTMDGAEILNNYCYDGVSPETFIGKKKSGSETDDYALDKTRLGVSLTVKLNAWVAVRNRSIFTDWKTGVNDYPVLLFEETPSPEGSMDLLAQQPVAVGESEKDVTVDDNSGDDSDDNPGNDPVVRVDNVSGLSVSVTSKLAAALSWTAVNGAEGYEIYRTTDPKKGYALLKKVGASKKSYTDASVKKGTVYYYCIKAYKMSGGSSVYGGAAYTKKQIPWMSAPQFTLSKKKKKKVMCLTLKKYEGTYVEVYFRNSKGKYVKAPLKTEKISYYKKKLSFTYQKKTVMKCKIRTYKIRSGKKCYSMYSKVKTIRL